MQPQPGPYGMPPRPGMLMPNGIMMPNMPTMPPPFMPGMMPQPGEPSSHPLRA